MHDTDDRVYLDGKLLGELLTTEEAEVYLRLEPKVIYELLANKKIPYIRYGTERRFVRRQLDNWLERSVKRWSIG